MYTTCIILFVIIGSIQRYYESKGEYIWIHNQTEQKRKLTMTREQKLRNARELYAGNYHRFRCFMLMMIGFH